MSYKKTCIITISGGVSSGKSPIAKKFEDIAKAKGFSVIVNDHCLYSFKPNFDEDYNDTVDRIQALNIDVGIIVVGIDSMSDFSIRFSGGWLQAPMDFLIRN
uniref:Uncharacterized protein n=1 Tax=Candidatus Kentrum sp. TUN TaxID=2126343 RepID=A0A451A875_9GAMM|nr:MAG: hypothetical protein BECKTUN1418D_GA0071000_11707 [Candidatus Kentron sp. TUN]